MERTQAQIRDYYYGKMEALETELRNEELSVNEYGINVYDEGCDIQAKLDVLQNKMDAECEALYQKSINQ